jgi:diguanylate cyclase (GGDEF)-like protein
MMLARKNDMAPPLPGTAAHGAPAPRLRPIPWGLIVMLSMIFLGFWQFPPLDVLKHSTSIFPLTLHTIEESFAVVVSILVFAISWHTYDRTRSGNISIIACGFLAVGLLDFGHMLSYRGMPDFVTPASPQKAIVFWLAARYVAAATLLIVALRPWTPFAAPGTRYRLMAGSLALSALVYALQLLTPEVWPVLFIPGEGLSGLKIAAEYGIIAILGLTAWLLYRQTQTPQTFDAANLFTATLITILSELCFTLYSNVNDIFSLVGHTYKVIAYFCIYRAVFVASIREPYQRLAQEIDERQVAEARIQFLAYHDPVTTLPNRLLTRERFETARQEAREHDGQVALAYLDLDNFKTINDSLGHSMGNQLLQAIAARLREQLMPQETIGRQGGDEFLAVLPAPAGRMDIEARLALILEQMQIPFAIGGHDLSTSVSIGVAVYPDDGQDFETLLRKADTAMYRAKAAGRNGHCFFDQEMVKDADARLRLRNDLRPALERGEFLLHYQPQIDLASGRVIGAEALIRWQHPELGMVPPGRFIGIAEETGLIVPISEWAIRTACRQAVEWQAAGARDLVIAVNLSAVQFMRGDLVGTIASALAGSGLEPRHLELELTESILIQGEENILATVQRLHAIGVQMSIDDFGTGYSSLSYLKRFAVDKLKIDQSFVRDLASDPEDAAIVRAIIQMAHSLGLKTIAEGVETAEILALLRTMACDEAQGYYFARPLPAAEFSRYIQDTQAQPASA